MDFKQHLYEVLSNELMSLKRYLTMDDETKSSNRAFNFPYAVKEYLDEKEYDKLDYADMEEYEIVEWLNENDIETLLDYGEHIVSVKEYYNDSSIELYDAVDYRAFIRSTWLLHFSDNAVDIWKDQNFKFGVPYEDYDKLALSTHYKKDIKNGGFNFAYDIKDVQRYYRDSLHRTPKYGKYAVLFKGDGIKVYHNGDEEPQVIFDGKMTQKPIILVLRNDSDKWEITSTITDKRLFESESIEDVARWVEKNYAQYRKHLEPK